MWVCCSSHQPPLSLSVFSRRGWAVLLPVPLGLQGLQLASMFVTFVVGLRLGLNITHTEHTEEKMSVQYMTTDMIKLMKDSMKSVNCNLSICSISVASHASMERKNYAFDSEEVAILIIIVVTVVHKWASVGLMASHERLSTDSLWHKTAPCPLFCNTKWPLCLQTHLWQCDNRCMQIWDPIMTLGGCRSLALQRKSSFQLVELHQMWNKTIEAKHIFLVINTHINIYIKADIHIIYAQLIFRKQTAIKEKTSWWLFCFSFSFYLHNMLYSCRVW